MNHPAFLRRLSAAILLWLACGMALAAGMSVVFINPGRAEEPYWRSVTRFMQPAAAQLDIRLEVLYAERDYLKMIDMVRDVTRRAEKPDYLIIVNEKLAAGEMIKLADKAGIRTMLAFSTLEPEQQAEFGPPRRKYQHWIGSVTPNAADAGRISADDLAQQAQKARLTGADGKVHIALVAGDKVTPTGVLRLESAQAALAANSQVVVEQVVHGNWDRARAREQAATLLVRYPQLNAIWTASDLMAYGVIDAAEAAGRRVGRDFLVSAINNSPEVMQARVQGRIAALAGGHFTAGGIALVLLYDYHHQIDFANPGAELRLPLFTLIDADMAQRFLKRFGDENFSSIDFRAYSRHLSGARARQDFSLASFLRQEPAR